MGCQPHVCFPEIHNIGLASTCSSRSRFVQPSFKGPKVGMQFQFPIRPCRHSYEAAYCIWTICFNTASGCVARNQGVECWRIRKALQSGCSCWMLGSLWFSSLLLGRQTVLVHVQGIKPKQGQTNPKKRLVLKVLIGVRGDSAFATKCCCVHSMKLGAARACQRRSESSCQGKCSFDCICSPVI